MKNLIFILAAFIIISSCRTKNDPSVLLDVQKDQELLDDYFIAATVGVISASDELKYVLHSPIESEISQDVLDKVISITPHVEGITSLSNGTILTFKPNQALAPAQTYTVKIDLPLLDKKFDKVIEYEIKTFRQDMTVDREGIIINDDGTISVMLGVKTADKVNVEHLKSCFDSNAKNVEVIERGDLDYEVECRFETKDFVPNAAIKYNGKNIGCDTNGEINLEGINSKEFGVLYTYHNTQSKEFNIYFSQKINKLDDLTGLVKLNNKNASYNVRNNVITIFLGDERTSETAKIELFKGIKSTENKTLLTDYSFDLDMQVDNPTVAFVSDGNYFPSEGNFKIPIKTRALNELRVVVIEIKQENVMHYLAWQSLDYGGYYNLRMYGKPVYDQVVKLQNGIKDNEGWNIYGIDLSTQIQKNPGSIYHISLDFLPQNTALMCKDDLKKFQVISNVPSKDFYNMKTDQYEDYYYYEDDYRWEERTEPCKLAYYVNREPVQKIFICSDYSVIAKKAGNNYHVALSKLMDLSHVSDAELTLYDLQSEKIATLKTSSQGLAQFENTQGNAAVLKVEKNRKITYLSLDQNLSNTLTEFDIEGERSENDTEFYIYTERDVWRPGDSIFVDLMVNHTHTDLPNGMPIVLSFYNTENLIIDEQRQVFNKDKNLIYTFKLKTNSTAKTGVYRAKFQIGPKTLRKNIRVETIKPNTAEVTYEFDKQEGNVVNTNQLSGKILAKYLTGFEITGAKVKSTGRGKTIPNPFPKFKDYYFDVYDNRTFDKNFDIVDQETNEQGMAIFDKGQDLKVFNTPINVSIETETILPGGGTNKEGKSIKVYPFDTYLGASRKDGKGWNGNHTFQENIEVNLVNVTAKGELVKTPHNVIYHLQKHINSWWVDKYRLRSSGNFVDADYWKDIKNSNLTITGKGKITFPKGQLEKGAYKLTMEDEVSGHKSQVYFTVYDGIENIPGAQPYIVDFQVDKEEYKTGESVKVKLPDIEGAKALISIERGNRVIEQVWYNMSKRDNVISLTTDENWAPNVYIHITIMQKYKQEINDLPLRMYGVKYIKMDGSATALQPVLNDLPEKLESNKTYTFVVKEEKGRNMEYTLAIVDEGLLNLTGFTSPDPAKHFNGKYPLLVKTWDVYQYLINYFKGKFAGIISIGGDDAYNPDAIVEVNRFKPVVIHQGSFKLNTGGQNIHKITIPNYIGKVRMMIVACNDHNFGKLEKFIPVKNPLMLQTQFPRTLNVSDKLQLPLTILRDDNNIKSADISVKTNPAMVQGFSPKSVTFNGKNQLTQMYDIRVLDKTGKLNVEMTINGGGKSMKESTDILVNYPNSYESFIAKNIVEVGNKLDITIKPKGFREVFTSKIMISGLKVPNFTQYADELIDYPYGCLEQTTSKGFSQLYLDKVLKLDPKQNRERLENLQATINKLSRFQQSSGKFNYWDNAYYDSWSDIYAGNFLIELKKLGYFPSNTDVLKRWLSAQVTVANNWAMAEMTNQYNYETESMAQAFRLFVLAKGGSAAKSAMNRFVSSCTSKNPTTWWLISGSFKLSGYDSKAIEFMKKAESLQISAGDQYSYYSFGSTGRDLAIKVEVLSYLDDKKRMDEYYDAMVDKLNLESWASTQTKGFAFLAAFRYFGKSLDMTHKIEYTITGISSASKNFQHSAMEPNIILLDKSVFDKTLTIKNIGKGKLFVYQSDRFIDNNLVKPSTANNLVVTVDYFNVTQRKSNTGQVNLGDDIVINVKVNNPTALEVNDLALNVKMPSGWELKNPRLYETEKPNTSENFVYQDFKDDRVYTFFNLKAGENVSYEFKAKAAFTGDFFLPSITCEHMYKGNVNARTESGRVGVGK